MPAYVKRLLGCHAFGTHLSPTEQPPTPQPPDARTCAKSMFTQGPLDSRRLRLLLASLALLLATNISSAQRSYGYDTRRIRDLNYLDNREGIDIWQTDRTFKHDLFTFVRLQYSDYGISNSTRWLIDYPSSELNLSFRLQQMTSMKVNPIPITMRITDPRLHDYPFTYIMEVGDLEFTREEIPALRNYLLNGGFLMVDDHWGLDEQANFLHEIKRVFPDRPIVDLTIEHPIFHNIFEFKTLPQVPGIYAWARFQENGEPGRTWERLDDTKPHYRAIYDDKGRMIVLICANTDFGDGWEREASNEDYFHAFSEKQAYPMAINILYYVMTH